MTTIAYRDGVLAADTRAYSGGPSPIGHKQKIFLTENETAFGVATANPGLSEEFRNWFANDKSRDHEPRWEQKDFDILEVTASGDVFYYHDSIFPTGPLTAEYFAIGSGDHYAMGAMAMGASATEAVSVAAIHDVWSAVPVQMITVIAPAVVHVENDIEDVEVTEDLAGEAA